MQHPTSFIAEARREQIIEATIRTLDEIGYVKTSLAKIAKKANISTGLISYHFKDKDDVIHHTLVYLLQKQFRYIQDKVSAFDSAPRRLTAFIEASIAYQGTHRIHNVALIEIIFNARTPEHVPYYKLSDGEEDPLYALLQDILRQGQETKQFTAFDPKRVSVMIQGAISESMLLKEDAFDLEKYKDELVRMATRMVTTDGS